MILIEKRQHIKRLTVTTTSGTVNGTSVKIKRNKSEQGLSSSLSWSSCFCCCCSSNDNINLFPYDKRKIRFQDSQQGLKLTRRIGTRNEETLEELIKTSNLISNNSICSNDTDHRRLQMASMRHMEEQQESGNSKRRRRRRTRHFYERPATTWLLLAVSLIISINHCTCDTGTTTGGGVASASSSSRKSTPTTSHQFTSSLSEASSKKPAGGNKVVAENKDQTKASKSHAEQLVSTLSESIERQHLRMSPIRSFVQQRPSKFDSGHEATLETQSTGSKRPKTTGASLSKAEDRLRHVVMMHEHAASNRQRNVASGNPTTTTATKGEDNKLIARLRQINPLMQKQQPDPINSNKIITQALSYLSPLIRSKPLLDNILAHHNQQASSSNLGQSSSRPKSPFSGRANNKISSIHGLSNKLATPTAHLSASSFSSSTDSPKTSVSAKPSLSGDQNNRHSSTPMSLILDERQKSSSSSPSQVSNYEPPIDLIADSSSLMGSSASESGAGLSVPSNVPSSTKQSSQQQANLEINRRLPVTSWLKHSANQMAHGYVQDSLRDLLTLSQLPILSGEPISTAPSDLEPGGKKWLADKMAAQQQHNHHQQHNQFQLFGAANGGNRSQALDDILRYAYIFGSGVRRKRDPLKVLGPSKTLALVARRPTRTFFKQRSNNLPGNKQHSSTGTSTDGPFLFDKQLMRLRNQLKLMLGTNKNAKPRGVMWDMATDPSLAVTVFHLLERASVALPLGFLLMPFVQMIRNPLNGIPLHQHGFNAMNLGRILPARASHRSVDYEELAKRLDMMDKILSRALRQTHREA